jgi:purine-binding chemotaxis protein CheW
LLCRVSACVCAVPSERVTEVMRPLPIEPLSRMPGFVLGLSIIRGSPVPVIDARRLLNGGDAPVGRFVTMAVGDRVIALAVEQVIGIRSIDEAASSKLPPLFQDSAGDAVMALRVLDGELLLLLDTARIVPEALLEKLSEMGPRL